MKNKKFYTDIKEIKKKDAYTVLVNKFFTLKDYEPIDLISLSYDKKYKLRKKAAKAFEKLIIAAKEDGIYLRPYSAFREYNYQQEIYQKYVEKDGQQKADTYSARPGHSEHQTGLAVDVWSDGYNELKSDDAKWLKEHAPQFGFIIRYTKEKEDITGYIEEPWHLRYLGKKIAKDIVKKNISYDEYYDLYLK